MKLSELKSMTVIQLRRVARENNIILSAGMNKAEIIEKLSPIIDPETAPVQQSIWDEMDSVSSDNTVKQPETEQPASLEIESNPEPEEVETISESDSVDRSEPEEIEKPQTVEPKYQAAWHSPNSPVPGHQNFQAPGVSRPAWQNTTPSGRPILPEQRPSPLRAHSFGPRFGPASMTEHEPNDTQPTEETAPSPVMPSPISTIPSAISSVTESDTEVQSDLDDSLSSAPTLEELLSSGDFVEGSGILELHPDGYGFLRAPNFLPSSKDIYVSMAQIRRFSLRTGDYIEGKIRPQREGDKFAALLYIDTVNGISEEESLTRPLFDELTPVYPSRRISLENLHGKSDPTLRLIDLIAPLGFGQRGLLLCPPDTGKRELLQNYANVLASNYPDITVLTLLINVTPEDVTWYREQVSCPVLASTFDQAPEAHLRLTEMVMERAMRLVEQKKDVIILVDSLTLLAKVYSTAALQQGRNVPGMVNPASLLRAKKLFGAARAMKEGGSLTVIATMDVQTGNRVDDSVVEEFKGTANMELTLDQDLAKAGITPAINLHRSFTKNSDILLNNAQKEGLNLIRQLLGTISSETAIPQLISMMDKTSTNAELLTKMKDWFALMNR